MGDSDLDDDVHAGPVPDGRHVCAIVVTFHPDSEFPDRISRMLRQVKALVIVDNGSDEGEIKMLREFAVLPSTSLILNLRNLGIARALNIGVQRAATLGCGWVLLLDQDTLPDDTMVEDLFAVRSAFPDRTHLAVIGSGFRETAKGSCEVSRQVSPQPWEEAQLVITSGSLIPLATHAVIGSFREELFIDSVDADYCYRARAKGFHVIKTRKLIMTHSIGASTQHNVLWMKKWTTNHSPDRRYYIARNSTVMLREHGNYRMGLWVLKSFGRCFRLCKRIALYEQMKGSKILAVGEGWLDGLRGRMGPRRQQRSKSPT